MGLIKKVERLFKVLPVLNQGPTHCRVQLGRNCNPWTDMANFFSNRVHATDNRSDLLMTARRSELLDSFLDEFFRRRPSIEAEDDFLFDLAPDLTVNGADWESLESLDRSISMAALSSVDSTTSLIDADLARSGRLF